MDDPSVSASQVEAQLREQQLVARKQHALFVQRLLRKAEDESAHQSQSNVRLHDPWGGIPAVKSGVTISGKASTYTVIAYGSNNYPIDKPVYINSSPRQLNSKAPTLPRYKSILRLGPNVLAWNDRTLKSLPYFLEEQGLDMQDLLKSLGRRFDKMPKDLVIERKCSEQSSFWYTCVMETMQLLNLTVNDIMFYLLVPGMQLMNFGGQTVTPSALQRLSNREKQCPTCNILLRPDSKTNFVKELKEPLTFATLATAALLCRTFLQTTKFSIWHVISKTPQAHVLLKRASLESVTGKPRDVSALKCAICGIHDCPGHGAYSEDERSSEDEDHNLATHHELNNNRRRLANSSQMLDGTTKEDKRESICGIFCCDKTVLLKEMLGLNEDSSISGVCAEQFRESEDPSIYVDTVECKGDCFWRKSRRRDVKINELIPRRGKRFQDWTVTQTEIYKTLLPVLGKTKRGACVIAAAAGTSCRVTWEEILVDIQELHQPHKVVDPSAKTITRKDAKYWLENSETAHLDDRVPFTPCLHEGSCENNQRCSCWLKKISCEATCKCPPECSRRFRGCKCRATAKTCFMNEKCDCWRLNRECDPWLCGCGVLEVLDPVNRHDKDICRGKCKNAGLQRDVPKRTIKAPSEVQGWGLFAGEEIAADEFVGEYKGEIISLAESDRRGEVYHHRGMEYLFILNEKQQVDSTRAGNKIRFINNSQKNENINCRAQKFLCAGAQRIGLYSTRHIKAGEELFFNYGYPEAVTKNFWEKGENGPRSDHELRPKPKSRTKGRVVAVKEKAGAAKRKKGVAKPVRRAQLNTTKSQPTARKRRREELDEEDLATTRTKEAARHAWVEEEGPAILASARQAHAETEISESSDGDYRTEKEANESSSSETAAKDLNNLRLDDGSENEAEDEAEDDEMDTALGVNRSSLRGGGQRRQRIISQADGRLGGRMQKKGWVTRKKNMQLAAAREKRLNDLAKKRARKTKSQMK